MTHRPTTAQPALFLDLHPERRTQRRPLAETHPALAEYREAWEREYRRPLKLPSFAETARHAKRIAEIIEDPEIRRAFFAAYLSDSSPFLARNEHRLRYAQQNFARYRKTAEWAVAERRRFLAQAAVPERPRPASWRQFGRKWLVDAFNRAGVIILTHEVWAGTIEQAEALATSWWLREAPFGIHHIQVQAPAGRAIQA